ncbi:hypothetical protein [Bradyrhizobium tunisiense]|uniref:hypothetical protein n=1 Tax=Bradyrhizobium tunisiense TaxID=3278709 RepID=UPI0035D580BA
MAISLPEAIPVFSVVGEGSIAEEDSIAERVGLYPLDHFRAFQSLGDVGTSEEDIAARISSRPQLSSSVCALPSRREHLI